MAGLLNALAILVLAAFAFKASDQDVVAEYGDDGAALPRIEIASDAQFEKDWMAAHRAWLTRVMIEPFVARSDTPPWKGESAGFLRQTVAAWTLERYSEFHPEMAALGKKLRDGGCDDPLIRFFSACWDFRNSRATHEIFQGINPLAGYNTTDGWEPIRAMQAAVQRLDESGYSRALLRLFALEIWRDWSRCYAQTEAAPWATKIAEWTAGALSEGSYRPEDASIFVGQMMRWPMQPRNQLDVLKKAVSQSRLPEWAKKTLLGSFAIGAAWNSRGGGYANTVTPEGFRGFEENESQAQDLLTEAWKLEPGQVAAPGALLETLLTGGGREKEDPVEWLQRAWKAQPDFYPAASNWLFYHRPRWGGTVAEMLAFARACLEAHRYDTELPELFVTAVYDAASESGGTWRRVTRIPWVADGLVEATQGELNEPSHAAEREKWQSLLAARAFFGGKFAVAKKALAEVAGGKLHPAAQAEFRRLSTYEDWMEGQLSIYGTPAWEEYAKGWAAVDEYRTSNRKEALEHWRAALAQLAAGSEAARFLDGEMAVEAFEDKYETGEWTSVPLQLPAWRVRAGKFFNDSEGALVAHSSKSERGFIYFQGLVGQRYELRGHFASSPGGKGTSVFGLAVRASRTDAGQFLNFGSSPADKGETYVSNLRDHFRDLEENGAKPQVGRGPTREDNEFFIRVTPTSVSFELNGQPAVPEFNTSRYARDYYDGRIGLVASHYASETDTKYTKLEVRRIGSGK